jgi:hypothetical protein
MVRAFSKRRRATGRAVRTRSAPTRALIWAVRPPRPALGRLHERRSTQWIATQHGPRAAHLAGRRAAARDATGSPRRPGGVALVRVPSRQRQSCQRNGRTLHQLYAQASAAVPPAAVRALTSVASPAHKDAARRLRQQAAKCALMRCVRCLHEAAYRSALGQSPHPRRPHPTAPRLRERERAVSVPGAQTACAPLPSSATTHRAPASPPSLLIAGPRASQRTLCTD